jgi:hypothetical protein
MDTRIGTVALTYLAETGGTIVGYADTEAQAIIAGRAGWVDRPAERIRLELLAALDRDERFAKDFAHVTINGQTRKVRVYYRADTSPPASPVPAVSLPLDPWRRRLFLGALLDIDPHAITDAHAVATLAVLPTALSRIVVHTARAHHQDIWAGSPASHLVYRPGSERTARPAHHPQQHPLGHGDPQGDRSE